MARRKTGDGDVGILACLLKPALYFHFTSAMSSFKKFTLEQLPQYKKYIFKSTLFGPESRLFRPDSRLFGPTSQLFGPKSWFRNVICGGWVGVQDRM